MDRAQIERLRVRAAHCRQLADGASDAETAAILRQTADDIELAIPILEAALQKGKGDS